MFQNKISIDVPQAGKQHSLSVTTSESVIWKINITKGGDFIAATPSGIKREVAKLPLPYNLMKKKQSGKELSASATH